MAAKIEHKKKIDLIIDAKASIRKMAEDLDSNLKKSVNSFFNDVGKTLKSAITDTFKSAINELDTILQYSQLSSSRTRELTLGYGFSSAQAYGWEKALEAVGLESEEDLYYTDPQELEQFRKAFEKYSNQYSELYDSGFFTKMQEYQFEMQDFKNEMMLEVVEFFMDNKDVIKSAMQAMIQAAKVTLNIFNSITEFFRNWIGESEQVATTSDIINQYNQTTSSSVSNNVNITNNNNMNGVSSGNEDTLEQLKNMTYKQVMESIQGGSR